MLRILSNFVVLASALLCVGVVVLWASSYRGARVYECTLAGVRWAVASDHGRLSADNAPQRRLEMQRLSDDYDRRLDALHREWVDAFRPRPDLGDREAEWRRAELDRIGALRRSLVEQYNAAGVAPRLSPWQSHSVPDWLLVAATAVVPALWLAGKAAHAASRRRLGPGACPECGYDLRATPGRCPECGHAPAAPAPRARMTAGR